MNKAVFDLTGVTAMHEKGILGKGVKILVHESDKNKPHAYMTLSVIQQIAPQADIEVWNHNPMTMHEEMLTKYAEGYDLINRSFSGDHTFDSSTTNTIVLSASGNSEDVISQDVRDPNVIGVGAVTLATNGKVYRELCGWDDLGMPIEQSLEIMGFDNLMTSEGSYSGTSCATPFVTGLLALIACDYKQNGVKFDLKEARSVLYKLANKYVMKPNHSLNHIQATNEKVVVANDGIMDEVESDIRKIGMGYATLVGYESPKVVTPKPNYDILMQVGNTKMYVDGKEFILPVAPKIVDDYTLVPFRAIVNAFGAKVDYDNKTKEIRIKRK